jgi:hypothetical protein
VKSLNSGIILNISQKRSTQPFKPGSGAYQKAKDILNRYRKELDQVAEKLLEVESLTASEFFEIFPTPVKKTGGIPKNRLTEPYIKKRLRRNPIAAFFI